MLIVLNENCIRIYIGYVVLEDSISRVFSLVIDFFFSPLCSCASQHIDSSADLVVDQINKVGSLRTVTRLQPHRTAP